MRQGVPVRVETKWKIGKGRTSSYPIQTILEVEPKRDATRVHYNYEADIDLHDSRVKNSHRTDEAQVTMSACQCSERKTNIQRLGLLP